MESVLLDAVGESKHSKQCLARPPMDLKELDSLVRFLQSNLIERSTKQNYSTGVRDYIQFCSKHHLSLDPSSSTLSRYIAYTSKHIASGPKYLSGARHYLKPLYPHFDESRSDPLVQATIRGSKKIRADPVHRKPPLRISHIELAYTHRHQSYDDLLFATMLSCAFYGCHRIGELTVPNQRSLFDFRKLVKRATLHFESHRAGYRLPYHKADRFYRGTDVLFCDQSVANPVTLLQEYTSARDSLHGARPALFICSNGSVPNRSWFESRLHAMFGKEFGCVSCRAGGATYYASLGLQESILMALGRWSSSAWKIYIRDNPAICAEMQLAAIRRSSA